MLARVIEGLQTSGAKTQVVPGMSALHICSMLGHNEAMTPDCTGLDSALLARFLHSFMRGVFEDFPCVALASGIVDG